MSAGDPGNEKSSHFWVNGIVAMRDKMPYVQLSNENGMMVQFSVPEARQVAMDILQMSARTEADAMVLKFFDKAQFPPGAGAALMDDFRNFRAELDSDEAKRE
jgi:hypothetical protein